MVELTLRSAFLIRANLSKEAFIATGVMIAIFIDLSRLAIYLTGISLEIIKANLLILIVGILSAFAGAYLGNKMLKKITLNTIQIMVSVLLFIIAIGLGTGLI